MPGQSRANMNRTSGFIRGGTTANDYSGATTRQGPRDDISGMSGSQFGLPPVASIPNKPA